MSYVDKRIKDANQNLDQRFERLENRIFERLEGRMDAWMAKIPEIKSEQFSD